MKINEFVVGSMIETALVVKSAVAKETKNKKPYLSIEFFDGQNSIMGNYWDWTSGNIPPVNAILTVKAQVTEWQGVKQLNVKSLVACTDLDLSDFMPTGDFDIQKTYDSAVCLMSMVKDETLRTIAMKALEELEQLWRVVPGAVSIHHNFVGGNLVHSYHVACIADAIAESMEGVNKDLVLVGAMLHDIGKLYTYKIDGVNIDRTANGKLYEHIFMGAEFIGNFAENWVDIEDPYVYGKVRLLRHIILSHHGCLEFGSPVTPQCIEAYIVHHADALDAAHEQLRVASNKAAEHGNWTEKIWALNNRPHLTMNYTAGLMKEKTEE